MEYVQYTFSGQDYIPLSVIIGRFIFNYLILPQLLWFKKLRKSLVFSLIIILIDFWSRFLDSFFTKKFPEFDFNFIETLNGFGLFLILAGILFFIKTRFFKAV